MCGILAYTGKGNIRNIVKKGLKSLEYRGYDACGYAFAYDNNISIKKEVGKNKIESLTDSLPEYVEKNVYLLSHTRWATHGDNTEKNAHPHYDCKKNIFLVHNGIIENYNEIKNDLLASGHKFIGSTDTEAIPHILESIDYISTPEKIFEILQGSFACVFLDKKQPFKLFIFRRKSPLIVGKDKNTLFISSDMQTLSLFCNKFIEIKENIFYQLDTKNIYILPENKKIIYSFTISSFFNKKEIESEKENIFMKNEIWQQPETIKKNIPILQSLINEPASKLNKFIKKCKFPERIIIAGCGTSWHAGLIGKIYLERFSKIITQVEYASEFRYNNPVFNKNTWFFALSQSGETADTIGAMELAKLFNIPIIGIVNNPLSTIDKNSDFSFHLNVGTEIGVAATKSFTMQILILFMLSLFFAKDKKEEKKKFISAIYELPEKIKEVLNKEDELKQIVEEYFLSSSNAIFLGRGYNYPTALEGALKMKEISYIHAEGSSAAEMKHGPLALVDKNLPVVFIVGNKNDITYEKIISNMHEVKSRNGKILSIVNQREKKIDSLPSDKVLILPETIPELTPIINVVALQIISFYAGILKGCDVDKPRNLAKSVTVE
jgi:glucosamine--fructose-6-phosphate aminotransferase (isomerizing)